MINFINISPYFKHILISSSFLCDMSRKKEIEREREGERDNLKKHRGREQPSWNPDPGAIPQTFILCSGSEALFDA